MAIKEVVVNYDDDGGVNYGDDGGANYDDYGGAVSGAWGHSFPCTLLASAFDPLTGA